MSELDERDASMPEQDRHVTSTRPERWLARKSTCVTSPVTTIFEPNPSRVKNICICSGVVFWASSRMMNESFSVRPAHERERDDLDRPPLHEPFDLLGVDHVVERVEEGPQVRVDLRLQVAGQKAEPLARLDRRAGEDDPPDVAARAAPRPRAPRQVRLAGARRARSPNVRSCSRIAST